MDGAQCRPPDDEGGRRGGAHPRGQAGAGPIGAARCRAVRGRAGQAGVHPEEGRSGKRRPRGDWAFPAVGFPDPRSRPCTRPVTAFPTHDCDQGRVPLDPEDDPFRTGGRAQPPPAARPWPVLAPRSGVPSAGLPSARDQRGFTQLTRPVFRSPVATRMDGRAWAFAPRRLNTDDASRGRDRPSSTNLKQRSRQQPKLSRQQPKLRSRGFTRHV